MKAQMKSKENNPHFVEVNSFFGEVREYIEKYKAELDGTEEQE